MAFLEVFANLTPFVQLSLVTGGFATIFIIAYNRTAATNLITFLRDLYDIRHHKERRNQQGLYRQYFRSQPPSSRKFRVGGKRSKMAVMRIVEFGPPFEAKQDAILKIGKREDTVE